MDCIFVKLRVLWFSILVGIEWGCHKPLYHIHPTLALGFENSSLRDLGSLIALTYNTGSDETQSEESGAA